MIAWGLQSRLTHLPRFPLPGYSRYDDSDPLENEQRAALHAVIEDAPGVNLAALVERTHASRSSARYHLRILEHEGLVTPLKLWGKRRYYPLGHDDVALDAALRDETRRTLLEAIAEAEPIDGRTLAETVDRDPATVSHHLTRLADADLVAREREGRAIVNRLTPPTRETLGTSTDGLEPPETSAKADD